MNSLDSLRNQIDALDQIIMDALNQRFSLMKDVKAIKALEAKPTLDSARETAIIAKTEPYEFKMAIQKVYHAIMSESKALQDG